MNYCPNCGDPLTASETQFCGVCGADIKKDGKPASGANNPNPKTIAYGESSDLEQAKQRARDYASTTLAVQYSGLGRQMLIVFGGLGLICVVMMSYVMFGPNSLGLAMIVAIILLIKVDSALQDQARKLAREEFKLQEARILEIRNETRSHGDSDVSTSTYIKLELPEVGRKEFSSFPYLREKIVEGDTGIAVLSTDGEELWHFEVFQDPASG